MNKSYIVFCFFVLLSFSLKAQVGPKFIDIDLNKISFVPGEKAVLTVYKLATPHSESLKIHVETQLTSPDNSTSAIGMFKVTDDVGMGVSSSLVLIGSYSLGVKAYLEEPGIILPLKEFIEENHKRICKIDALLETETNTEERIALINEKNERLADIELAKIRISSNRTLLQEETRIFSVSGNLSPSTIEGPWYPGLTPLLAHIEEISGNLVTVNFCANLPVRDPEDGSLFDWKVNFGDGNEITFNNKSYSSSAFLDHGCVKHSYLNNVRPTVTYTAIDKEGAAFTLSQTFDFRTNTPRPIPNLKITNAQKVVSTDENGKEISGLKVSFDPFKSRIPSDSGLYLFRFFPYGSCGNISLCPEFYNQEVPFELFDFTYRGQGNFYLQFAVRDNLLFNETVGAPVHIDIDHFPNNPTKSYLDSSFGPAAIIQVSRNNVKITDLNKGVEVKFDGSSSFDLSGDDSKLTYYWDFGDPFSGENFSRSRKTSHTYKNPGHYFVFMYVRDEHGNESIDDWMHVHVTHESLQSASLQFFAYRNTNNPLEVMFSTIDLVRLGSTSNVQFYWDYGDGTQDSSYSRSTVNKTYEQPGIYNVSVTFQDINGEFVKLTKTIDTTTLDPAPSLVDVAFNPSDFAIASEDEVTASASLGDNSQNYHYWWNFDEAKFSYGGAEEAAQSMVFDVVGVKHIAMNVTNETEFSTEFRRLYPVGLRELSLSHYEITNINGETKVDYTIDVPSNPQDIERIEISNFERGWSLIENPTSLSGSAMIYGVGTVTIVVTDKSGNKNAFVKEFTDVFEENKFPVSDLFMKETERMSRYRKHLTEQTNL